MGDRENTADGRWHASEPAERKVRRKVFRNTGTVRIYTARIFRRRADGQWDREACPHHHMKRSAARACGERTAKRWNREESKEGEGAA